MSLGCAPDAGQSCLGVKKDGVGKVYNPLTIYLEGPRFRVAGTVLAPFAGMWRKIGRLFVVKNRFEAMAVIYALAVGAVGRGYHYLQIYPGIGGDLLFLACTGSVFMAGAKLMEITRPDSGARRRRSDLDIAAAP